MAKKDKKNGVEVLKRERQLLPVLLTDSEFRDRATKLAGCSRELSLLEAEQEEIKGRWKARKTEIENRGSQLAQTVRSGAENRPVSCEVQADYDAGTVSVVRMDDGTVVQERKLLPEERQGQLIALPESDFEDEPEEPVQQSSGR
jgi:hypothetical protein